MFARDLDAAFAQGSGAMLLDLKLLASPWRLPLESIRFRSGTDVRMGIMFFRRISRLRVSWSWPEMTPGQWVFETHVPVVFSELRQRRIFEVILSAVFSRNQARLASEGWPDPVTESHFGASLKYGLTSTVTLDTTFNPDFSQVESDAFEVEVNQRFPVFFSEKRPFFMEGLGLFNLAASGGDGTMRTAVHTRRVIDPLAGVKLTGTAGRQTFAFLNAADESPEGDADRLFTIGRVMRNTGPGQFVGALVTDTEYRGSHNRVAAADLSLRRGQNFRVSGAAMYSDSRSLDGTATNGGGALLDVGYNTRRFNVQSFVEHFGTGFQMDTAFINRVGITRTFQYGEVQFYPDQTASTYLSPNTALSGDAHASFLLGVIDQRTTARGFPFQTMRVPFVGAFVHDDWKVSRRLTLNLGVRWEWESAPYDDNDIFSRFLDLSAPNAAIQAAPKVSF